MEIVAIVAVYAAVISTVALLWQIFTWRKSRPNITITTRIELPKPLHGMPANLLECTCTVVNSGGHHISIVDLWADFMIPVGRFKRDGTLTASKYNSGPLPFLLGPGECRVWLFTFSAQKDHRLRCNAKDALGRVHRRNVSNRLTR